MLLKVPEKELEKIILESSTKTEVFDKAFGSPNPNSRSRAKIRQEIIDITGKPLDEHMAKKKRNGTKKYLCPVCGKPRNKESTTCGYSCANTYFRSGKDNPNYKGNNYRTVCFAHHKKECVVCGESLIVEVHHLDENKDNNDPNNLIPLCPTHHQYWHSSHKDLVYDTVMEYVRNYNMGVGQ